MAATTFDLEVWADGADEALEVRADQRDIAAFEVAHKVGLVRALDEMPVTFFRFLAWHALRRTGAIEKKTGRESWDEGIISVDPADDDDQESPDPGNPVAHDETSSTSL